MSIRGWYFLKGRTIHWHIQKCETVVSTQDIIRDMAMQGAAEGAVAQALRQTGGRGCHGRSWVSEPGNLYMSVLLRPSCPAQRIGQLSIVTAVALARAIGPIPGLALKWPNDLLIEGKKCAGILIETELARETLAWATVGVGVNIVSAPPEIGACVQHSGVDDLRDAFLDNLDILYALWQGGGFEETRREWLRRAHPQDSPVTVKTGSRVETGLFDGIDEDGNLVLMLESGDRKKITAGDIFLSACEEQAQD